MPDTDPRDDVYLAMHSLDRDERVAAGDRIRARLDHYEHAVQFETNCLSCAQLLDRLLAAEARLNEAQDALALIADYWGGENRCESFTSGSCRENGGRSRDAEYSAEKWCAPCIATAALAVSSDTTATPAKWSPCDECGMAKPTDDQCACSPEAKAAQRAQNGLSLLRGMTRFSDVVGPERAESLDDATRKERQRVRSAATPEQATCKHGRTERHRHHYYDYMQGERAWEWCPGPSASPAGSGFDEPSTDADVSKTDQTPAGDTETAQQAACAACDGSCGICPYRWNESFPSVGTADEEKQ